MEFADPKEDRDLCRGLVYLVSILILETTQLNVPSVTFLLYNLTPAFPHSIRKRRQGRLHPHLDGLKRTQRQVGKEFCRRRSTHVYERLVCAREELLSIQVFEVLVKLSTVKH
jgi:hypothetical protein